LAALTYAAFWAEPSVGVLLPWHLVVRAEDDHTTVVEAANLQFLVALTGNRLLEPRRRWGQPTAGSRLRILHADDQ
jgi:hypothetical protein